MTNKPGKEYPLYIDQDGEAPNVIRLVEVCICCHKEHCKCLITNHGDHLELYVDKS